MRFLPIVAALGTVNAILLPPTISSEDKETIDSLSFESVIAADNRITQLPCPGCPVEVKDILGQSRAVTAQVESALRLNFSITHNENVADQLMLNGLQIYPLDSPLLPPQVLTADQLVKSPDGTWNYVATPYLGYVFRFKHLVTSADGTQIDLTRIHVQIIDVGAKKIDGIPVVELKILETASGKLMIGESKLLPSQHSIPVPASIGQECTSIVCKWQAMMAAKLSSLRFPKLKGCNGSSKHSQALSGHESRPHGSHQSHRHRHRHSSFARFVRGVVFHVFIPILIGVFVGITASLVGMAVGHLAIFLFRLIFRRGHRTEYQKAEQDESESLLEHQLPPPVYEDAPTYEEVVGDEKLLHE